MAHVLQLTQIQDGPSDVIYSLFLKSDGGSGELTNYALITPANLVQGQNRMPYVPAGPPAGRCFNIQQMWYNFQGFDAVLSFASANPLNAWLMAPSTDSAIDFRPMGGIPDRTPDSDVPQGTILLSTDNFAAVGSVGSLIIKVRKLKP